MIYLTIAQPDIAYSVQVVSQFVAATKRLHLTAGRRIFIYLRGTSRRGLFFPSSTSSNLHAFADADWQATATPIPVNPLQDGVCFSETL